MSILSSEGNNVEKEIEIGFDSREVSYEGLNTNIKRQIYEFDGFDDRKCVKAKLKCCNEREIMGGDGFSTSFAVQDALSFAEKEYGAKEVLWIHSIFNKDKDKRGKGDASKVLQKLIQESEEENPDRLIISAAAVSIFEYSPEEYYLNDDYKDDNKKPLPVEEALEKSTRFLEKNNFVDFNKYIGVYELQKTMIYDNAAGKKFMDGVKTHFDDIIKKQKEEAK